MSSTGLAAAVAMVGGLAGAVQISVQGRLSERVGAVEAMATASVVGGAVAVLILLGARRSLDGIVQSVSGPAWMLLGGVMSAVIILSITVAGPRIGIVATTAVLIAAQFAVATVIDDRGWFGVERIPITWSRAAGLLLLATGAVLVLRRS